MFQNEEKQATTPMQKSTTLLCLLFVFSYHYIHELTCVNLQLISSDSLIGQMPELTLAENLFEDTVNKQQRHSEPQG